MRTLAKVLLLGALAGCSSESWSSADDIASVSEAIIGGTVDSGDPSVVVIGGGGVWCTGTLIAPEVVLTAAHCISAKNSFVYFGPWLLGDAGSTTGISKSYQHPDYAMNHAVDIGIVILSARSAVTPTAIATTALGASDVSTDVHVVGFGDTASPSEPFLTKMQIDVPISSVTADAFYTGPAICGGDSGGPAMRGAGANQAVVGVISGHSIQACGGTAGYVRVDLYAQWIQQQIDLASIGADAGSSDSGALGTDAGSSDAGEAGAASESSDAAANAGDGGATAKSQPNDGDSGSSGGCAIVRQPREQTGAFGALLAIACAAWRTGQRRRSDRH